MSSAKKAADVAERILSVAPTLPPDIALASLDMAQHKLERAGALEEFAERLKEAREAVAKRVGA